METLGHDVTAIDLYPSPSRELQTRFSERVRRKFFGIRDLGGVNEQVTAAFSRGRFDVLWIDKGLTIDAATLRFARQRCPTMVIAGYSPDDMMNPGNQSRQLISGLPLHDVYFTTKTFGVDELMRAGCPRVEFVPNAYDALVHRPLPVSPEERERLGGAVGFIGGFEKERARSMVYLAEAGIPVRVWGPGGWPIRNAPAALRLEDKPLWGDDYAKALCAFDINLCFLRKVNRDRQTQRSVEIPACGAFMLAERTDEHLALFTEGVEAAFFSDDKELLEKVRYYLDRPEERRAIADAGRQRCLSGGYSNHSRIQQMFKTVRQLLSARTATSGVCT
jgi:hypothetical protein